MTAWVRLGFSDDSQDQVNKLVAWFKANKKDGANLHIKLPDDVNGDLTFDCAITEILEEGNDRNGNP